MKKYLIISSISLLLCTQLVAITITGSAFLEGASDHSGIRALFTAVSPTAVTDSTFTNAIGTYSLTLSAGIYEVSISKKGYGSINEGQMLLSTSTSLFHDSLEFLGFLSFLGPTVAGTLYKDTNYVILSKTWLKSGDQLYIEPGTHISFAEKASFDINGSLIAEGTANEKIYFELFKGETGFWNSLNVYVGANDFNIKHCHFEKGSRPIQVFTCRNFLVENCTFKNSEWSGIKVDGNNTVHYGYVGHNTFTYSHANAYTGHCDSMLIFEHNIVRNMGNSALQVDSNAIVRYNKLYRNKQALAGSPKEMHHNDIYDNLTGIGTSLYNGSKIYNNTFYDNGSAAVIWATANGGDLTMNCFVGNDVTINFVNENNNAAINFNYFERNAVFDGPGTLGYGTAISTNSNGDDIDAYLNVVADSVNFYTTDTSHPHAFFIRYNSPCVDAGDPNYKDDDNSIRDIGAHPFVDWVGVQREETNATEISVYPNPLRDYVIFDFNGENTDVFSLQIFDLIGNRVFIKDGISGPNYRLDNLMLQGGIYFYQLNSKTVNFSGKLMVE